VQFNNEINWKRLVGGSNLNQGSGCKGYRIENPLPEQHGVTASLVVLMYVFYVPNRLSNVAIIPQLTFDSNFSIYTH
jgi:hypothetical protein